MHEAETFMDLLYSAAHWQFEILVSVVFLICETLIFWPIYRAISKHHTKDDDKIAKLEQDVAFLKTCLSEKKDHTKTGSWSRSNQKALESSSNQKEVV